MLYFAFIMSIFGLFLIIEISNAYCAHVWEYFCCCCKLRKTHKTESFSNNIYEELGAYDLRSEYRKTKNELDILTLMINKQAIVNDEGTRKYLAKMQEKRHYIRVLLMTRLQQLDIGGANDTMDGFYKLLSETKNDHSHRMRTLYSYDIQENPKYKRSRKGEKRVREYL